MADDARKTEQDRNEGFSGSEKDGVEESGPVNGPTAAVQREANPADVMTPILHNTAEEQLATQHAAATLTSPSYTIVPTVLPQNYPNHGDDPDPPPSNATRAHIDNYRSDLVTNITDIYES